MIKLINMIEQASQYLTEGFARIFSPAEEGLPPAIGVQPFDCNLYVE